MPCASRRLWQWTVNQFAATRLFFVIVWRTLTSGQKVAANQWGEGATTLEWTVESPAPFHTHEDLPDMTEKQPAE